MCDWLSHGQFVRWKTTSDARRLFSRNAVSPRDECFTTTENLQTKTKIMTICNAHDQEVCYESPQCPACEIQIELDEANEEIAKLEKEVEELNQATDL